MTKDTEIFLISGIIVVKCCEIYFLFKEVVCAIGEMDTYYVFKSSCDDRVCGYPFFDPYGKVT